MKGKAATHPVIENFSSISILRRYAWARCFLTATPVNNSIHDFRHILELFTNGNETYFAPRLGIHNVRSHFVQLLITTRLIEVSFFAANPLFFSEQTSSKPRLLLKRDSLFEALVVQRSRAYVKTEPNTAGSPKAALFPERDVLPRC